MRSSFLFLSAVLVLSFFGCSDQSENQSQKETKITSEEFPAENIKMGFQHLNSVCFSCHSIDPGNNANKVAHDMGEISRIYKDQSNSFEDFHQKLATFINQPEPQNKLLAPEDNYGSMPNFNLSDKEILQIATYLYQSSIEESDWYAKHYPSELEKHKSDPDDLSYIEKGKKLALSTKSVLGKNLKGAIKKNGTSAAISFCNTRAITLTDSMSQELNAHIKRVSDQPRNPNNEANEQELEYLLAKKQALKEGKSIAPQLQKIDGKMVGYYPITTNKMCLQCHGLPDQNIQPEVQQKLNSLYPNDAATGYGENELRGIWVVEMDLVTN
ncbi:DUF3365 domain-containing protein [bacterium SCSIO 12643]|nr:DUF3365 domain-containing protein [bacterium SCSIO 12643]